MLIICVLILAYMMAGKNIEPLLEKVKNIDWKELCREAWENIKKFGNTVKREACDKFSQNNYSAILIKID